MFTPALLKIKSVSVANNWQMHRWFYTQIELTPTLAHSSLILKTCCSIGWFLFSIVAYNLGVIMWTEIDSDRAHFDIWFRSAYSLDLKREAQFQDCQIKRRPLL